MCPVAGVSSACRPHSSMWSLSSFQRRSISVSILSTACGIRFMSFNISSSFVVCCDAKSNSAKSRIVPVGTSGLAVFFFFFCFGSTFVSMVDKA